MVTRRALFALAAGVLGPGAWRLAHAQPPAVRVTREAPVVERTEFDPPVRLHPHKAHLIVYRLEADHLLVIRVLHRRSDWTTLIEEAGPEISGK